jgi:hypothetical protein
VLQPESAQAAHNPPRSKGLVRMAA